MKSYLNVEFGAPDLELLQKLTEDLEFTGTRTNIELTDDFAYIRGILQMFQRVPTCKPIFLIPLEEDNYSATEIINFVAILSVLLEDYGFDHSDYAIEFCNEPNVFSTLWKGSPELLGEVFMLAYKTIRTNCKNITILSPSISNLDRQTQSYGYRLFRSIYEHGGGEADYGIAFHRYPVGLDVEEPHKGFASREEEFNTFVSKVMDRPRELWCTETGYSQMHIVKCGFLGLSKKKVFKDSFQQLEQCYKEYMFWSRNTNVTALNWYQLNDGPSIEEPLDNFGIRYFDGVPKPLWQEFRGINRTVRGEDV